MQDLLLPRYLKLREAVRQSGVSIRTLQRAIATGGLTAFRPSGKTTLIRADHLLEWIERTPARGKPSA